MTFTSQMTRTKQLGHQLYYHASLPVRWLNRWRWTRRGRAPLMILFYHRVADVHPNPWTMSNACFAAQVEWLRERFDLISLEEMQRRMRTGQSARPAVSLTFDDGYAENCEAAIPLLVRHQIPCTYFVTLDNIRTGRPFPHDLGLKQPLRPNTLEQLKTISASGIEIGCHTRTHADLGALANHEQLRDEVVTAGEELAELLDRPVRYFAFPFGMHANLSARAFQLAEQAGYEAVCSAYGGYNFPGDDAFHLQRIHGDPEFLRLRNHLTVDPRKLRSVRRYARPIEAPPAATPGLASEGVT